ncbi:MAG: type I DNA topoisomerase [Treponema sp.]|jgi:DNA topoisomerase-1|nr:type I DNA topoisomerase [Treponema sp.]
MAVKTAKKESSQKSVPAKKDVSAKKSGSSKKGSPAPKDAPAKKGKSVSKSKANSGKRILVIVESPTKAASFEKYLGPDYTVKASMGHLIDLPKSRTGVDTENNFTPEYITVRGRAKILKELLTEAKKAETVLLASDPDREGEAIAWHLKNAILSKLETRSVQRISFNEVTPLAIKEAVANPRPIDEALVESQKARRVLDRLVGYSLSPLLWKKVKNGLSAGRVQSVALRLICEREKEVESFIPEEYWTLDADFLIGKSVFTTQLVRWKGGKPELPNEAAVQAIIAAISGSDCVVSDIKEVDKTIKPKAPFITSEMQKTAANRLGFTARKTMQVAQQLYEGINIGSTRVGLISYMRTDSVRISPTALEELREWIGKNYPKELPEKPLVYATGGKAQDAHEAIRPTYVSYTPDSVAQYLNRDQLRLYTIIWERFVSSQMTNAKTRTVSAEIQAVTANGDEAVFRIAGTKVIEKGFYQVLKLLSSKEEKGNPYPPLKTGDKVKAEKFHPEQHFTQGPPRYTEASIIDILREKDIGRPSTYAPIISVLLERYYVTRSNKQLVPTLLGKMINDVLVEYFPQYVDAAFTALMETKLDKVEESQLKWPDMLREFWGPFKARVDEVGKTLESFKGSLDEPTDYKCEKCGRPLVKKLGRFGFFLACTGFPECRTTRSVPLAKCPKCGGDVVARKTKGRGKEFYGCTRYPDCDFISHFKPINQDCPQCGQFMVEKYDKKNGSHKACINPNCDYLHSAENEE